MVLVAGVRIWDSVPEARVVGVAVPLVVVEPAGPCFAAFLARNLARRAAGSLSMLNNAQWKTTASVWEERCRWWPWPVALWGSYDFLCAKEGLVFVTRHVIRGIFSAVSKPMMQNVAFNAVGTHPNAKGHRN